MQIGNFQIKTSFDLPPIPDRQFDWSAWCDGLEEWKVGRGQTELDAIVDLRNQLIADSVIAGPYYIADDPEGEPEPSLEDRVAEWVRTRIGGAHLHSRERAMRLLEEAMELAQAEGISADLVAQQTAHVYARPAGEPSQEAAGVAVCLFGWCASRQHRLIDLAIREIERIEAKPVEQIRGSVERKADADLVTCVEGYE